METFDENTIHFLRSLTEEHWQLVKEKALETLSEEEFEEFCRQIGVEPDDE